jgi:hypothetical protein
VTEYKRCDGHPVMDTCTWDLLMFIKHIFNSMLELDREHPKIDFSGEPIRGSKACALILIEVFDQRVLIGW